MTTAFHDFDEQFDPSLPKDESSVMKTIGPDKPFHQ
jgi:hypothetical protein